MTFHLLSGAPLQKNLAQMATSKITIENSRNSPLEIISATAKNISLPPKRTEDIAAHLVSPDIVVKNNSDKLVSVYVLEFTGPGSARFYLTRKDLSLASRKTDSIGGNSSQTFIYPDEKQPATAAGSWTVRLSVVRFADGTVVTLRPSPIPPPSVLKPLITVDGKIQQKKLIKHVDPVYPDLALRARVQGKVMLDVMIDETGSVSTIKDIQGPPVLSDAAVNAVKQWKYSQTLLNGKPVPVATTINVEFNLK